MSDLAVAPEPTKTRAVPTYHVFRVEPDGLFRHLTDSGVITAKSRRQAMRAAAEREEDKGADAQFLAIRETEYDVKTRNIKQEVKDTFN